VRLKIESPQTLVEPRKWSGRPPRGDRIKALLRRAFCGLVRSAHLLPSLARGGRRPCTGSHPAFFLPAFSRSENGRGGRRAVTGLKHSCVALSAVSFAPLTFCHRWRDVAGDPAQVLILLFFFRHFRGAKMVGVTGFEPAASSSRTTRATKLRYTPMFSAGRFLTPGGKEPERRLLQLPLVAHP